MLVGAGGSSSGAGDGSGSGTGRIYSCVPDDVAALSIGVSITVQQLFLVISIIDAYL